LRAHVKERVEIQDPSLGVPIHPTDCEAFPTLPSSILMTPSSSCVPAFVEKERRHQRSVAKADHYLSTLHPFRFHLPRCCIVCVDDIVGKDGTRGTADPCVPPKNLVD